MSTAPPSTEPTQPSPGPLVVPRRAALKVRIVDKIAAMIIRLGGTAVIVAVLAIFLFIGRETWPLFRPARSQQLQQGQWPASDTARAPALIGVDEYETYAYALDPADATLRFVFIRDWKAHTNITIPQLQGHPITTAYRTPSRDHFYVGTKDGYVLAAQLKFRVDYADGGRQVTPYLGDARLVQVSESGSAVRAVHGRHNENGGAAHFSVALEDGSLLTVKVEEGEDPKIETVGGNRIEKITHLALDEDGRKLFAATDAGKLYHWYLEDSAEKPYSVFQPGGEQRQITALDYVIGNNALLLGFSDGSVEEWFGVRDKADDVLRPFRKIRSFESLPAAVTRLQPSGRDKGFLAGAKDGTVRLYFTTSGRTLLTLNAGGEVSDLCYAPKLTSLMASTTRNQAKAWLVHNPHPEISWQSLFGKVWYEGHDKPKFDWQSTGGSDDFESKFSLVPLTVGTLKGAFYGLLFAIPVAVLAALYTSQFMHSRTRALVKPTVEIMAALPSVVIGFLAGLWLAPALENHVISVALMFVVIPLLMLIAAILWHQMPQSLRTRIPHGMELTLIIPLVLLGFFLSVKLGPLAENLVFHGDFKQWVFNVFGQQFEQRNSIVIGFAMGFAVIPIIFTISEDALSNVPQHFSSGSLALGATRWQTATRIILPTASPGIFSAIMIGFGRAVGETMIVLMATGNTPILSFSPFNGMRTLSANIAVEIPEAPIAGTLYRVLFMAAMLLFVLTFVVNTVAEIIRQRLREKYQAV
jgi:phosphate transport system permease protein